MAEASWAVVGVTFVLALLTGWYAWATHQIVRRMDRQQEEMVRPWLTFEMVPWQPNLLKLRVGNVGPGSALNIKGEIRASLKNGESVAVPWSYHLLPPNKYEEFGFPMPADAPNDARFRLGEINKRVATTEAHFTYSSVSGYQYKLDDAIPVERITSDWINSRMLATEDHPDRLLPRIAKALEDLAKDARQR